MKLYYTTSVGSDQAQPDPTLSLGGYKSSSPVSNANFNNLFSGISQFLLSKNVPEDEYIGLILKNKTDEDVVDLMLHFDYPVGCFSKFLVACVDLRADANDALHMEHILNRVSIPLHAEFYEADGPDNAVNLGNVAVDGLLGLWICRRLITDLASDVQTDAALYENDPVNTDLVRAKTLEKSDSITMSFNWSTGYGEGVGEDLI